MTVWVPPAPTEATARSSAGFRGELRLRFARDGDGRTVLSERFRQGLFHLGKAYREENWLILQVVNPTAGVFENDQLSAAITVGPGARAALFAPASTQVYTATGQGFADSTLAVEVAAGASLIYLPRWMVLHRGARYRQHTVLRAAKDASALFLDPLAAGRIAHGEFLEMDHMASTMEIHLDDRLALRERMVCGRDERRWIWRRQGADFGYFSTLYVIGPDAGPELARRVMEAYQDSSDELCITATAVEDTLTAIRILATRASLVRRALTTLHALLPLAAPPVFERINRL